VTIGAPSPIRSGKVVFAKNGHHPPVKLGKGSKMTEVARDQFVVQGKKLTHVPTGARFTAGGANTEWGSAGLFHLSGDDYERKAVLHMATPIMREMASRA
jgi:hypothetical protein